MSEDEVFVLVLSGGLTATIWLRWYRHCQAICWSSPARVNRKAIWRTCCCGGKRLKCP